jgi:hypothetical protein
VVSNSMAVGDQVRGTRAKDPCIDKDMCALGRSLASQAEKMSQSLFPTSITALLWSLRGKIKMATISRGEWKKEEKRRARPSIT